MPGLVALFALAVAIVAVLADPGAAADQGLAAVPVAAFAAWALRPRLPLPALAVAVLAPVVVAQRGGALEPLLFEASLLALVVAHQARSWPEAALLGVAALLAPVLVAAIQDPAEIATGIWVLGIALPWVLGRAAARQEQLAAQLAATRLQLADQALVEERRAIARDVHDLVGHGLAAVLLQLTSARHVLRRDPDAAEEALRAAEEAGRRSMRELRRTVAGLRSDERGAPTAPPAPPPPSAAEVAALVEDARRGGLAVELRVRGDLAGIAPSAGLALYRIAQEALANAARHAPGARTVLELEATGAAVRLAAETAGPTHPSGGAGYGLVGMRERAAALGGELAAGPTPAGWLVECRLPLEGPA